MVSVVWPRGLLTGGTAMSASEALGISLPKLPDEDVKAIRAFFPGLTPDGCRLTGV